MANPHKSRSADPTPDEIWGAGGLAEQQRALREKRIEGRRKNDPNKEDRSGLGRIRVCKTTEKLRGAIE